MLHFCPIADLTRGVQMASRFTGDIRAIRDATTAKINKFIRRNLEYSPQVVEYFDTPNLATGHSINLWLEKKRISSLTLDFSTRNMWDDNPIPVDQFVIDAENGKLTMYGFIRAWKRGLRVTYAGGYEAIEINGESDVMDCPPELRFAAGQQAVFDARRILSGDQGTQTDDDKKTPVAMMGGLLLDTANAFLEYRRPLGR